MELRASAEDAQLLRGLAAALADEGRTEAERAALRARLAFAAMDFKELLASAPLEGVDLGRSRSESRPLSL